MDVTKDPARKILPEYCREQDDMVTGSRKVLLDYCDRIEQVRCPAENASFGRGGSIRYLLVHIANCYKYWIGQQALSKDQKVTASATMDNIATVRHVFEQVDTLVFEFLDHMASDSRKEIHHEIKSIRGSAPAFKLFTHIVTHEFHHKGQLLSLSRRLGYTPVDTDIMR